MSELIARCKKQVGLFIEAAIVLGLEFFFSSIERCEEAVLETNFFFSFNRTSVGFWY